MTSLGLNQLYQLPQLAKPDAVALISSNQTVTFSDICSQIECWATHLQQECGLKKGARVALYDTKSVAQVAMLFAIWRAGGVVVLINPALKVAQVEHILFDSAASLLITSATRADALMLQQSLPRSLQCVVTTDKSWCDAPLSTCSTDHWQEVEVMPAVERKPNDLAALVYTSGSTGLPKGVMLSQKNLMLGADSVAQYLGLNSDDRVLALLPFSFDYGLNQLLSGWHAGASVVLHNYFLPSAVGKELKQQQVTVLAGVPPLWRQILTALTPELLATVRLITNSGGALTAELISALHKLNPQAAIFAMYGLTEAFRSSFLSPKLLNKKPKSVGQAIPHARLMVLNGELKPCYPGEPGELVHAGELVALGYWRQPEQSAERFIELPEKLAQYPGERAVRSGDLAYIDNEGDLFILGRKDEQIKTSGYRVSPQEVEALALSIDGVEQAVCFGIPDAKLGQALVIVIQGKGLSQSAFRNQYQLLAANYLWPKSILQYEVLPLNGNGKIDRPKLKKKVMNEIDLPA